MSMKYSKEKLETIVKESSSVAGVLRKLGLRIAGGNYGNISRKIKKFGIDTSHFTGQAWSRGGTSPRRKHWTEILVENRQDKREEALRLRRALIESGREYKCEKCGLKNEWQGEEIRLQVDHIDGNFLNNRKENLRFLCPNCHSQTENFSNSKGFTGITEKTQECYKIDNQKRREKRAKAGNPIDTNWRKTPKLNQRKVDRPTKDELETLLWQKPTLQLAKDFGVSDKAIEKWAKAYGITKPPRGYWAKLNRGTVC